MKPVTLSLSVAVLLASIASLLSQAVPPKPAVEKIDAARLSENVLIGIDSVAFAPRRLKGPEMKTSGRFTWKTQIVTTVFWIGELPTPNNPTPNRASSWDKNWTQNYGGLDDPNKANRSNYIPVAFTPRQNPFYCALPYNDKANTGHRPEAARVVPWFNEAYQGPAVSTVKGRWVAIRKGDRIAYAQWEDAGPFRTDHWQYVFGNERPKPNLNKGAGLDISPAVRDFLDLDDTDVTDWKFVEFSEVPRGPWAKFGDNNTFVINERKSGRALVDIKKDTRPTTPR